MTALLIAMAVKSLVVLAGADVIVRCFRRHAAATRHRVWAAAVAILLLLPAVSLIVPATGLPDAGPVARALAPASGETMQPLRLDGAAAWAPIAAPSGPTGSPSVGVAPPGNLAAILWLLVATLLIGRTLANHVTAAALLRRASPAPAGFAFVAGVDILISADVAAPAVAGLWRRRIVLPRGALKWPVSTVRLALLHEAGHVRRFDPVVALAADLACALYWFNPLAWRARRRLATEAERACDDFALLSDTEPSTYADTLLAIARGMNGRPAPALLSMASPGVTERIMAIVAPETRELAPRRRSIVLSAVVAAALCLPLAALRPVPAEAGTPKPAMLAPPQDVGTLADPRSELIDLPYGALAARARGVSAVGPDAGAIALLKREIDHRADSPSDLVRERSVWALSRVTNGRLVAPLLADLDDADWRVRAYAAWGLGAGAATGISPALARLLADPVWRVRANAAGSLAAIGDDTANDAMALALADPAWQVRYSAVEFFARDPRRWRDRLRPLVADPHPAVRGAAEAALAG